MIKHIGILALLVMTSLFFIPPTTLLGNTSPTTQEEPSNPFGDDVGIDDEEAGVEEKSLGARSEEEDVPWTYRITEVQRYVETKVSGILKDYKENPSFATLFVVFLASLIYSIVHTAGPGHGKFLLGTFLLCEERQRKKSDALVAGGIVSLTHFGSSLVVGALCYYIYEALTAGVQRDVSVISRQVAGYPIILAGIIIIMTILLKDKLDFLKLTKDEKKMKSMSLVTISILSGIVPCPLALSVFAFAIYFDIYLAGVISVIGMALGSAFTVGSTALVVITGRHGTLKFKEKISQEKVNKVADVFRFGGAVMIIAMGIVMAMPS